MSFSIRHKLFLALAATSMFATLLMAVVVQVNLRADFSDFRTQQDIKTLHNILPTLQNHYRSNGTWEVIANNPRMFAEMLRPRLANKPPHPPNKHWRKRDKPRPPPPHLKKGPHPPTNKEEGLLKRVSLLDQQGSILTPFTTRVDHKIAIELNGKSIGWLGLAKAQGFNDQLDQQFLSSQRKSLYTVAAVAMLFALIAALLLAKHFIRPVQNLARSMGQLTQGNFSERINIQRKDELGKLSHDFNQLALSLEKNERLRRHWVADTSHELRTPIAILRGEIEAIRDGIRPASDKTMASLHEETLHLNKLVDDLHTLSLSDAGALNYHMEPIDIQSLIQHVVDDFSTRSAEQHIRIQYIDSANITIQGDSTRLQQLLYNLIENSLRYTDAPGKLDIRSSASNSNISITLEDTPPAPAGDDIKQLFERFYRTESSRNRKTGGSGLGLAICRNIVEAHQGQIKAYHAPSGGLGICISLPKIT